MALLVDDLTMRFGGVVALDGVSLTINPGETIGIIGPNGSGKTTLLNCLSGFYRPSSGTLEIDGQNLSNGGPAEFRRAGLVRTFQNLRVYNELSVLENVLLGMNPYLSDGRSVTWRWIGEALGLRKSRARRAEAEELAAQSLRGVGLIGRTKHRTGDLSYGEKKRLEIARATVGAFRYLLLDEPTAGLSPHEASSLLDAAFSVTASNEGSSLILVEHRLEIVAKLSSRMMLFDSGRLILDGIPSEVASDPELLRVYTGGAS